MYTQTTMPGLLRPTRLVAWMYSAVAFGWPLAAEQFGLQIDQGAALEIGLARVAQHVNVFV